MSSVEIYTDTLQKSIVWVQNEVLLISSMSTGGPWLTHLGKTVLGEIAFCEVTVIQQVFQSTKTMLDQGIRVGARLLLYSNGSICEHLDVGTPRCGNTQMGEHPGEGTSMEKPCGKESN